MTVADFVKIYGDIDERPIEVQEYYNANDCSRVLFYAYINSTAFDLIADREVVRIKPSSRHCIVIYLNNLTTP